MRNSFDILETLHKGISDTLAPGTIDGGIYLIEAPDGDEKENIVLNVITNPNDFVQNAVGNVNVEVMGTNDRQPNVGRMRQIVAALTPLIDKKVMILNGTTVHSYIAEDKGVMMKQDQVGKYFWNLRMNYVTL